MPFLFIYADTLVPRGLAVYGWSHEAANKVTIWVGPRLEAMEDILSRLSLSFLTKLVLVAEKLRSYLHDGY